MPTFKVTWVVRAKATGVEVASGSKESTFPEGSDAATAIADWESDARLSWSEAEHDYIANATQV